MIVNLCFVSMIWTNIGFVDNVANDYWPFLVQSVRDSILIKLIAENDQHKILYNTNLISAKNIE